MEAIKAVENGEKEKSWAGDSLFKTATQPLVFYMLLFSSLWEYHNPGGLYSQISSFLAHLCSICVFAITGMSN